MSFENKNLYHLLGNDVEDEEPSLPPRELVKKNTSSKKKDEAPAKADPSRAKPKKQIGGNEGALKTKLDNKSVAGPTSTPSSHYKKPLDRHSRQQKGGQRKAANHEDGEAALEEELEAELDAELEQETGDVVETTPKKSLQEYLEELKLSQSSLDGKKSVRSVGQDAGDDEKIVRNIEEYVPASVEKKVRNKTPKEKQFLQVEATFDAPETREPSTRGRGGARGGRGRGAPRGGARGGRGDSAPRGARGDAPRGKAPRGTSKPSRGKSDAKKVDLADEKKFPSL